MTTITVVPGRNPPTHLKAKAYIARAKRELTDDDKALLVAKWNKHEPMTQSEIALVLGVSHTRVQQIELRAMAKIRKALTGFTA